MRLFKSGLHHDSWRPQLSLKINSQKLTKEGSWICEGKLGHCLVTAPSHVRTAEEDTDEGVWGLCLVTITTAARCQVTTLLSTSSSSPHQTILADEGSVSGVPSRCTEYCLNNVGNIIKTRTGPPLPLQGPGLVLVWPLQWPVSWGMAPAIAVTACRDTAVLHCHRSISLILILITTFSIQNIRVGVSNGLMQVQMDHVPELDKINWFITTTLESFPSLFGQNGSHAGRG